MARVSKQRRRALWRPLSQRCSLLNFAALALFGATAPASPASAQEQPPVSSQPPSPYCQVYAVDGAGAGPKELRANCRGQGLILGRATAFEAIINEALEATLVDVRLGSERRVLLLSIEPNGQPLVEDLTGQIALAAGRGPMSELDGVELDLKRYAAEGEIGVRGRPEDLGSARTDKISLGQQVAVERARVGGIAE